MKTPTELERKTIRLAAIGITIYLLLFFGVKSWRNFSSSGSDYQQLVQSCERLRLEIERQENKALLLQKLKQNYSVDFANLSKPTIISDASSAIQKAAASGGIQLGPIRETSGHTSAHELTSMQLEGVGPVPAIIKLLYNLNTMGYPLVIDSLQFTPDNTKPGMLKVNLTIVLIDVQQWKKETNV
jgi:hypothetical protein